MRPSVINNLFPIQFRRLYYLWSNRTLITILEHGTVLVQGSDRELSFVSRSTAASCYFVSRSTAASIKMHQLLSPILSDPARSDSPRSRSQILPDPALSDSICTLSTRWNYGPEIFGGIVLPFIDTVGQHSIFHDGCPMYRERQDRAVAEQNRLALFCVPSAFGHSQWKPYGAWPRNTYMAIVQGPWSR